VALLLACLAALSLLAPEADAPGGGTLAEGDAWYARRAEGARGGTADPGPVDAAIAAYRRAVVQAPGAIPPRCRLIRALFFRSSFCGAAAGERRTLLEEARRVADAGLEPVEASVNGAEGAERIEALRRLPGVAQLYFWSAVAWGEWAVARGKLAAARQGAGPRIRDLARTVIELDVDLEQGGGHRILGRLHDQSPKIPFLTGWVSRRLALESLRRSLERGPENTVTQLFLAEAILEHDPGRKDEARRLLESCASAVPRPDYLVEDAHYAELARRRLAGMR